MRKLSVFKRVYNFMTDKNVVWYKKLFLLLPIIYLILPFDFVTDFIPVAGQLDDIAVFVVLWPFLKRMMDKYQSEHKNDENIDNSESINLDKDDYDVE
jgi:uncharacterized membrane protein YkvA (DUF1232 family)